MTDYFLNRFRNDENGVFGKIVDNTGRFLAYTLEPPAGALHPFIPEGVYDVSAYQSPTKGDVWQVLNVPGRSNIEIHPGNTDQDTLGCILVGNALGNVNGLPGVLNSRDCFAILKDTLPQNFTLTIRSIL